MSGLRDKILSYDDLVTQRVEVPEWGGLVVELRTPTVLTRGQLVAQFMGDNAAVDYVRMYPSLIVATAYDPDTGEQLFTLDDMDALAGKSSKAMERLASVAMELAGMTDADQIEAGKDDSMTTPSMPTPSP